MPEAGLKDIFVSYSSVDELLVKQFVAKLEQAGISTWYAPADIQAGNQAIGSIEEGLRGSHALVVFLSSTALGSFWVSVELQIRINQMARDKSLKLIPVFLEGVHRQQLPETLQIFQYLDFNGTDWNSPRQLQDRVEQLLNHIRGVLPRPGLNLLPIPIVVFAMTSGEADDLASGRVFQGGGTAEQQGFQRFLDSLEGYSSKILPTLYGGTREEWKPRFAKETTIRKSVQAIVERINIDNQRNPDVPMVHGQFFSSDFWSNDAEWRRRTRRELEDLGYVLIVDAVSIFHPTLRRMLISAVAREPASMVIACPTELDYPPSNQLLDQNFGPELDAAFIRFHQRYDRRCEIGISYGVNLSRWLYQTLPDTAQRIQRLMAHPQNLETFRRKNEQEGVTATGLGSLVIGRT